MGAGLRITANQVTVARIVLLPFPSALVLWNQVWSMWLALGIFIVLGATDFVDGMMARRDGPTRLGALLDPIADKMFIVAIVVPCTGTRFCPWWFLAALLARELLVTALRSGSALRRQIIHTSRLAKMKTIIQMGGLGTVFLTVKTPTWFVIPFGLVFAAGFFVAWAVRRHRGKIPHYWMAPTGAAFLIFAVACALFPPATAATLQFAVIVLVTWLSGLDYLVGAWRTLAASGISASDGVRTLWALLLGIAVPLVVAVFPGAAVPICVFLSAELALGGVDNVIVEERHTAANVPFLVSSLTAAVFVSLVIALRAPPVFWMACVAASISVVIEPEALAPA